MLRDQLCVLGHVGETSSCPFFRVSSMQQGTSIPMRWMLIEGEPYRKVDSEIVVAPANSGSVEASRTLNQELGGITERERLLCC